MAINWDAYPGTEKLGWKSSLSVITQTRNDRPSPISWRWASQTGSSKLFNFLSGFANLHSSFCFGAFRAWKIPAAQRLVGAAVGLGGVLNSCYHNCLCPSQRPDPGAKLEIGQVTISIPLRVACPHLSTRILARKFVLADLFVCLSAGLQPEHGGPVGLHNFSLLQSLHLQQGMDPCIPSMHFPFPFPFSWLAKLLCMLLTWDRKLR